MKQGVLFLLLLVVFSAKAQLNDDFSDGNFTANPTWSGDDIYYQINPALELQSNGPSNVTTALSLSTPNTLFQNTEWQFYVKVDFNGTNSNQARIYLMSDQADLKSSLNGYYIGIGQDGNNDAVRLMRQQGPLTSTPTVVIPGLPGRVAKPANNTVRVRVLRDGAGNWTLLSDTTGTGSNYVLEGNALDNTITTTSYFGVLSRYTSGNSAYRNKFFYDDFLIQQMPLQLVSATTTSATQVQVLFSEPVNAATAQTAANYQINGGIGTPTQAVLSGTNPAQVLLTLGTALATGTTYTLTVNNVTSQTGTPIAANSTTTFTYVPPPVQVQPRQIVINEMMVDENPVVGLPAAEFVELFNTTNTAINLAGFTISDLTSTVTIPSGPNSVIAPGGFVILASNANAPLFATYGQVIGLSSLPSLNNSSDQITIRNPAGLIIDQVAYTLAWYNDPVKQNGGWTLEQKNPYATCSGQANWSASVNPTGGTPGAQNSIFDSTPDTTPPTIVSAAALSASLVQLTFSEQLDSVQALAAGYSFSPAATVTSVANLAPGYSTVTLSLAAPLDSATLYTITVTGITDCSGNALVQPATVQVALGVTPQPGELIINEIMADFNPQVGLPMAEFIELYNAGTRVLKLGGVQFTDGSSTATLPNRFLQPGQYLIVAGTNNAALFQSYGPVVGVASFPTLNDSGDSLVLKTAGEQILDLVQYTNAWYRDPTKTSGGWTLERINPALACSGADNWAASVDPSGGTPGAQNSIYSTAPDVTAPVLQMVNVVSATEVRLVFSEQLDQASVAAATISLSAGLTIASRSLVQPGRTMVRLILDSPLDTAVIYTVSVSGISDCQGNQMQPATLSFGIGRLPNFHELLITELMADPTPVVGLPDHDFVELYNASGHLLSLGGVRLSDPQSTATLPSQVLLPGEYVIVVPNSRVSQFAPFGRVIGVSNFPALNVASDVVSLHKPNGSLIFSVSYTDEWYKDAEKENGGWTLEMIDTNNPCSGISNWTASVHPLGGTPGQPNSVAAVNPDNTPPVLLRADVLNPGQVLLTFDEPLDSLSAASLQVYAISHGFSVTNVQVQGPAFSSVVLTFSDNLVAGEIYTLTITGLRDCSGNVLQVPVSVTLVLPQPAEAGDIIINEVLFNPRSGGVDFVELYNRSDKHIDLKDWKLANLNDAGQPASIRTMTTLSYVLGPGGYVVLTTNPAVVKQQYPRAREETFVRMSSLPSYPDTQGNVVVLNPDGEIADRFSYHRDMHFALIDDLNGVSLERINPAASSNSPSNWQSAASTVGFATPGYRNSQYLAEPGVQAAITVFPKVFTPDTGGDNDFTTIHYRFGSANKLANITVFDSNGRQIRRLVRNETLGTEGFIKWDGTTDNQAKANVGYYVFYIELVDLAGGEVQVYKEPVVVGARF